MGWLVGAFAISTSAQSFDNSGTANLSGDYFVRQVLLANLDQNTSAVGRALSIVGIMTFDGVGSYSFTGQKMDTQVGSVQPYSVMGGYEVAANGFTVISEPD